MSRGNRSPRWILAGLLAIAPVTALAGDEGGLPLPEFPGFTRSGPARSFDADSLYEYINGDAFTYQGFGCAGLSVQGFAGEEGGSITVEAYDHGSADNAFGIYSYERPRSALLLEIGGQGYLEEDRLSFFKGPYYVKLSGAGLGEKRDALLIALARAMAAAVPAHLGPDSLPPLTACFPPRGLDQDSIRYVARDFLGHRFLRSAFVAEYETGAGTMTAFILAAKTPEEASRMVGDYRAFLGERGVAVDGNEGDVRFVDPYHDSEGEIRLTLHRDHVLGTLGRDANFAKGLLREMETKLDAMTGSSPQSP